MQFILFLCLALCAASMRAEISTRGNVALQARLFVKDAILQEQKDSYLSASIETELYWENSQRNHSLTFTPFLRIDQHDNERTHADIREASWLFIANSLELRVGARQVFWGKAEFQHLVDIINQIDSVEDIDAEDKLGQPMLNLSLVRDYGIFEFFVLPYFRERTFPGEEGRLRFPVVIDTDNAQFESSQEQQHIDYALRWSHYLGVFDIGLSWFKGTGREPLFFADINNDNNTVLTPYYQQMAQWSIDGQATVDSWLLKWEIVYREEKEQRYFASQSGIEYTLYGVSGNTDLGLLFEYGWDERGDDAFSLFQNDVFIGSRVAFNDAQSSELLAGIGYDLDFDSYSALVEASRRFGDSIKASIDLRLFSSDTRQDLAFALRRDDHLQITAQYYF